MCYCFATYQNTLQYLDDRRASFSPHVLARFRSDQLISSGSQTAASAETPADPQYSFSAERGQELLSPQPPRPPNSLSPLLPPAGLRVPPAGAQAACPELPPPSSPARLAKRACRKSWRKGGSAHPTRGISSFSYRRMRGRQVFVGFLFFSPRSFFPAG